MCGALLHIVHAFHHPVRAVGAYEVSLPPDFFDALRYAALWKLQVAVEAVRTLSKAGASTSSVPSPLKLS